MSSSSTTTAAEQARHKEILREILDTNSNQEVMPDDVDEILAPSVPSLEEQRWQPGGDLHADYARREEIATNHIAPLQTKVKGKIAALWKVTLRIYRETPYALLSPRRGFLFKGRDRHLTHDVIRDELIPSQSDAVTLASIIVHPIFIGGHNGSLLRLALYLAILHRTGSCGTLPEDDDSPAFCPIIRGLRTRLRPQATGAAGICSRAAILEALDTLALEQGRQQLPVSVEAVLMRRILAGALDPFTLNRAVEVESPLLYIVLSCDLNHVRDAINSLDGHMSIAEAYKAWSGVRDGQVPPKAPEIQRCMLQGWLYEQKLRMVSGYTFDPVRWSDEELAVAVPRTYAAPIEQGGPGSAASQPDMSAPTDSEVLLPQTDLSAGGGSELVAPETNVSDEQAGSDNRGLQGVCEPEGTSYVAGNKVSHQVMPVPTLERPNAGDAEWNEESIVPEGSHSVLDCDDAEGGADPGSSSGAGLGQWAGGVLPYHPRPSDLTEDGKRTRMAFVFFAQPRY